VKRVLAQGGAVVDDEYYCFHHPEATDEKLRTRCECRKPRPGLLLQAAKDMNIDLSQSWMIGDGVTDIKAGKTAGCRAILLGKMKCELCQLMDEQEVRPDFIATNLLEACQIIAKEEAAYGNLH
jgi:D-glycero-D-manno-heptose 1,7-bisphosphate phosphatase